MSYFLSFACGVISIFNFQHLPNQKILAGISLFALFIILPLNKIKNQNLKKIFNCLLVFVMGFCWATFCANHLLQKQLAKSLENTPLTAQGYIVSVPEKLSTGGIRFEFNIQKLTKDAKIFSFPAKVRLTWEKNISDLQVGDKWQLCVRLKQPHGTLNPSGFDYEAWLFENHLRALGYVCDSSANQLLKSAWYHSPIDRFRQHLANKITQALNGNAMTGFITALTVGIRSDITAQQWQILRGTGTNHLMAIAGLHIGFVSAMTFFLIKMFWRLFPALMLRIPTAEAAAFAGLIAAFFYSAMAGFALPTQRAVIMLAVFLLALLSRRNLSSAYGWGLALFAVLLFDPISPLSSSFWLSFAAVALIIYGISARLHLQKWWQWSKMQIVIAIGLIPLMLLFFQQVSLAGIFANFIAIPWVGFLVMPLSFLGSFFLLFLPQVGNFFLHIAAAFLSLLWIILQKIAALSWLQWRTAIPNIWILLSSCFAIFLLLAPRGIPGRWLGIIGLLPLFLWQSPSPQKGEVWFTLLDVGQGLATVIRTQHHVLIYDAGAKFNDDFDMGDAVVVPYLRQFGLQQIDMLVISHGDNDHIGGAQSVLKEVSVKQIFTSIPEKFVAAKFCYQGLHWNWDGVDFSFLYPPINQPYADNDSSCVLKISSGKNSLLLTGDIERKSEAYLLQTEYSHLAATILVAPHHGSHTSSTTAFVQAVHPKYVLFPVGYLNRYNFPYNDVIQRYLQNGALTFDTVNDGTITFKFSDQLFPGFPECYRISHGKFWNS